MMELFPDIDRQPEEATDHDAKVSQFIKRWCMPWHQEEARKELDELIDEAVRNQIP